MAMSFKSLLITAVLVGLFIFSMISFSVYLNNSNDINQTILENPSINSSFGNLGTQLSETQTTANATSSSFFAGVPVLEQIEVILESIFGVVPRFASMMKNFYNLTFGLASEVLGISPIVLSVFTAILIISIVLLAWRLYKAGE